MRFASGLFLLGICTVGVVAAAAQDPVSPRTNVQREMLNQLQTQLKQAAAKVVPSVALIVVSRSEHYPAAAGPADGPGKLGGFDREAFLKANPGKPKLAASLDLALQERIPDHGFANGAVIDPTGLILTTYHAIEGAKKVYVYVRTSAGLNLGSYADIHAADSRSDLAVLKLLTPPKDLQPVTFADIRLARKDGRRPTLLQGEMVALAARTYSPGFLLDRPRIEFGSVTNIVQAVQGSVFTIMISDNYYRYGRVLEHDIKLNVNVTGAVLVNLDGNMVGLTTTQAVANNRELSPGHAIPMDENVLRIVDVLKRGEEVEYGLLGVKLNTKSDGEPRIDLITRNGPAEIAGLRPGDVVREINGYETKGYPDLLFYTGSSLAGSRVRVKYDRHLRLATTELILGKYNHHQSFIASVRPEPVFGLRVDHLSTITLAGEDSALPNGVPYKFPGVCIREVIPNTPAAQKLKDFAENTSAWRLTHVNGTEVYTPAEFYKAAKDQASVRLTFEGMNEPVRRDVTLP